jgi:hypothetical protein
LRVRWAPEISFGFGRWRKIKKQTANKANKNKPGGEKKDKSNQIPAPTNQMKPNTSTDKSNQI